MVDDVREGPLDVETWPAEYFPINQTREHYLGLAVRTWARCGGAAASVVSTLHQIDPEPGRIRRSYLDGRLTDASGAAAPVFGVAGGRIRGAGADLGVVGLYGVIAYSVNQRTREIGVRMALGAQRSSVYRLVMRQAGWLTVAGLAIGLVCSVGASMLIRKLLFGVQAWDGMTLGGVAVLLGLASAVASFLPARRAAS